MTEIQESPILEAFEPRRHADGCSGPVLVRRHIHRPLKPCRKCCDDHDRAYYLGGNEDQRGDADAAFRRCLWNNWPWWKKPMAWAYWIGVRVGGAPWIRQHRVSWAFGPLHAPRFDYRRPKATEANDARSASL